MTAEWRALFENHGCRIVQTPTAFELVGPNTFLFSASCDLSNFVGGLRNRLVGMLAMFVGNGDTMRSTVRTCKQSLAC